MGRSTDRRRGASQELRRKMAIRYTYSTNGQGIYGIDMETGKEGEMPGYPDAGRAVEHDVRQGERMARPLRRRPTPDKSGSWTIRFYQDISVNRVLEAIADGRDRVLLTLATGTGKTSIAFQIAWKLFNARWNLNDWKSGAEPTRRPRILFLADRNNLADQAYNDFTSFAAFPDDALVRIKPEDIRKKGKVPKNASLFFTIFQTFMSGPPKDGKPSPYFGEYPPDFFDFIVIDECHRGGANDESTWRDILEYFAPAVQLGLTATPKRQENADTYAYFGEPVYIYSLKEGINDGFLTPFRVKQIATTLDEYVYTPDDQVVEGEIEAGKRYTESRLQQDHRDQGARGAPREAVHGPDQPEGKDAGLLRHAGPCAGRARPHQPDEDEHGPELLPAGHRQRWRTRQPTSAGLSGQRKDHPDDFDHLAKALDRRGCPQHSQHRSDAPDQHA